MDKLLCPSVFLYWMLTLCYAQDTNVAHTNSGTTCSPTDTARSCELLIDGIKITTTQNEIWELLASGDIIGRTVDFTFDQSYRLSKIRVYHVYYKDERNVKTLNWLFDGAITKEMMLTQGDSNGNGYYDEMDITVTSASAKFTITSQFTDRYTGFTEIEIYGSIPISTTLGSSTTTKSTSPTTTEETTTPAQTTTTTSTPEITTSSTTGTSTEQQPESTTTSSTTTTAPPETTTTQSTTTQPTLPPTTTIELVSTSASDYNSSSNSTSLSIDTTTRTPGSGDGGPKYRREPPFNTLSTILLVIAVVLFIIIICVVAFVITRKTGKKKPSDPPYANSEPSTAVMMPPTQIYAPPPQPAPQEEPRYVDTPTRAPTPPPVEPPAEIEPSKPIPCESYMDVMDDMFARSNIFKEEYSSIKSGQILPTTLSAGEDLQFKNRYKNIRPYDHNRVVLEQIGDEESSIYINANYINAYNYPKYFIAAQGPNDYTVEDFWRMIWEQGVQTVVMITNLKEGERVKCVQYWPNEDIEAKYGALTVNPTDTEELEDYTIRTFTMSKGALSRDVRQYHYTAWKDESVPLTCSPLITFISRIRRENGDASPVLVHCSAGVGRTGTYIAIHINLDMAAVEGKVDILNTLHKLRHQRVNMIQTLSQYKVVHTVLLEYLYCGEVIFPVTAATETVTTLFTRPGDGLDTEADVQFKVLEVLKPRLYSGFCDAGKEEGNIAKNRDHTVLPSDNLRPYLRYRSGFTSDYINAVFITCHRTPYYFIATQHPLRDTMADFWRMVLDFNCSVIIMLNNMEEDDIEMYWPDLSVITHGPAFITLKSTLEIAGITKSEFEIHDSDKQDAPPKLVTHLRVDWGDSVFPKDLSLLTRLFETVVESQSAIPDSKVVVHDLIGTDRCGLYCAAHSIFDKIKTEKLVDVFNSVKLTRSARPSFIPDREYYHYLHEEALTFIDQSEDFCDITTNDK